MVVAMGSVGEVQVAVDEVVSVVSVGHSRMSAVRTMAMADLMPVAAMGRSACRRVLFGDVEPMFIDMVTMQMVQMSVVEIVGVAIMGDGRMPAVRIMPMIVVLMNGVVFHCRTPFVGQVGYEWFAESIPVATDGQ